MTPVVEVSPAPELAAATGAPGGAGRRGALRRDALIYAAGTIMRRAATLIMLPLYTRLLTPSDYGLLQMLGMTVDVAAILVSAGMTAGVMRFYFKAQTTKERHEVVATATALVLLLNIAGGLLMVAAAAPIHQHLLGGAGARYLIFIAAANFALDEMLTMPMLLMQIQGRAMLYSSTSLVRLVAQLALNILFLVVLRLGPLGILLSTLITNVVIGGGAMVWLVRQVGVRTNWSAFRDLRRFGVPYQIATAATFVLQFGDRFFLESYRGLAVVGLYGFAYQFGFMLDQLGTAPFMRAWQPQRFADAHLPREQRERADNQTFQGLTLSVVTLGLTMSLFARPALRIIASSDYFPAAGLVPLIVIAFIFQAWGGVVQFGIDAAEQTRYTSYIVWTSAAVILGLYALLVPPFGAYGAAAATIVSFGLRLVLLAHFAGRLWPQSYAWGAQLRIFGIAVVAAIACWLVPPAGLMIDGAVATLFFALYAVAVWHLALSRPLRARVLARITGLLGRVRRVVPA